MTTQTLPEALRQDTCTFPSYTIALHKVAANRIEELTAELEEARSEADTATAILAHREHLLERIMVKVPATDEDYQELCEIFKAEEE